MSIGRIHSNKKLFAQLLLLGTPTILLAFYIIRMTNNYFALLQNDWKMQTIYFGAGLISALIFYAFRFRFITTAAILIGVLYTGFRVIGGVNTGEFDAFFAQVKFYVFAYLFTVGWFAGYGFSRARYFTIGWSVFLLATMIIVVSHTPFPTAKNFNNSLCPYVSLCFLRYLY